MNAIEIDSFISLAIIYAQHIKARAASKRRATSKDHQQKQYSTDRTRKRYG
jgi:hypothetical protein